MKLFKINPSIFESSDKIMNNYNYVVRKNISLGRDLFSFVMIKKVYFIDLKLIAL